MLGKLKDMTRGRDGRWVISFSTTEDFSEMFDELADKDVNVEIKKASKHRSIDANNYAWALIDKIAARLQDTDPNGGWTPEKVYRKAIRDIGGIGPTVGMKDEAIDKFREVWTKNHVGRQVEVIDGSNRPGWSNVKIWFGSSDFDSIQMSRFINSIIQDAESLGIPTITDEEAERMIGKWAVKHE